MSRQRIENFDQIYLTKAMIFGHLFFSFSGYLQARARVKHKTMNLGLLI